MAEPAQLLKVSVLWSPQGGEVHEVHLRLRPGATLGDAVQASGLAARFAQIDLAQDMFGIWGRPALPAQRLADEDRVEIYRPLQVDPKMARRQRFQKQGARTAGLFASKRPGAKQGY
ncbi:MAG: RnfH family protein [Burkholderiaceae bacterium]|nr:RnfH family protein [Burkholderiaceae bacterium]MDO9089772.1 RnfH family protein [Burkholderiaceae bacterium]MDP1969209.1 RnfH family protein [Burkholderiaceae bacterium]